jgi:hypothetical protein
MDSYIWYWLDPNLQWGQEVRSVREDSMDIHHNTNLTRLSHSPPASQAGLRKWVISLAFGIIGYNQRECMGLLEKWPLLPCVHGLIDEARCTVYFYNIPAVRIVRSSQLSSSFLGRRLEPSITIQYKSHLLGHSTPSKLGRTPFWASPRVFRITWYSYIQREDMGYNSFWF